MIRFEMRTPPPRVNAKTGEVTEQEPVEYVFLDGHNGQDVVARRATDADRARYPDEYAAFTRATAAPDVAVAPDADAPEHDAPAKHRRWHK